MREINVAVDKGIPHAVAGLRLRRRDRPPVNRGAASIRAFIGFLGNNADRSGYGSTAGFCQVR